MTEECPYGRVVDGAIIVPNFREIAREYAKRRRLMLAESIGFGVQGTVFLAKSQGVGVVAVKIHSDRDAYLRERNAYFRLTDNGVRRVFDCTVPDLLHFDDDLLALEMTVVDRPYCLDFGGAYLDEPPPFSDDILAAWEAEKAEQFGPR